MTMPSCEEVIGNYFAELRMDFDCSPSADGWFLSTPFVKPDGEGVEIELQALPNGHISMSDMGDTLGYLYVNGLTLSQTLIANARQIAKPHGVLLQRNQLNVEIAPDSIGAGVHSLIQTILAVTDLVQKRRPTANIRFDDEVESLIIHKGIQYDVGFLVTGDRERHTVKFHVNSDKNLLIQPVSAAREAPARSWAERWAYRFSDILSENASWRPIVVLDDRRTRSEAWTANALTPVKEYAIMWSQRGELESLLEGTYSANTEVQLVDPDSPDLIL